jgi:NADPH-dependent 2,4-dienoyl-CoA reductase/sulfur reductase-like enzyme
MVDGVVIGAGPAGLAAALALKKSGVPRVLVVEREEHPGGILLQCIHNGFGLHRFREELTGPEYAERYLDLAVQAGVEILARTIVIDILERGEEKSVVLLEEGRGLVEVSCRVVVLAMGCRERNRGNLLIPGSRPAGIMTAGLAQRLVNIEGYLPGREVVILGSGDIGLIMARRLVWEGAHVKGVIEIKPFPGGLARNITQCLYDFHIPLYLSHTVSEIRGGRRIEAVEVSPIDDQAAGGRPEPDRARSFTLTCDCLLLSVGLIPENELSARAGVALDPITGGPVVDARLMTSVAGIFACGNVLHVHDLVDYVSEEAEACGAAAARWWAGERPAGRQIPVRTGNLVRYILPSRLDAGGGPATLALRPIAPAENVRLLVRCGGENLYTRKYPKVTPGSMIRIPLPAVPPQAESLEVLFEGLEKGGEA